ncbi:MAG: hypothetical protein AAGF14_00230 [Pseudomonadota bacterium]
MAREPKPKRGTSAAKSSAEEPVTPDKESGSSTPNGAPTADSPPPVEDTELLEMLEHLSKTIDTAHSVLDEQHRMVMEATQPPEPHLPGVEPVRSMAEPAESRSGPVIAMATAVFSAVVAIGLLGVWWLFLNQPESTAQLEAEKDESRIASSDGTAPDQQPPLPKKNPVRHVVAEVGAVPVQPSLPSAPSTENLPTTKVIDLTPYAPVDVQQKAPQKSASLPAQTVEPPRPVQPNPQPQVNQQVPSAPTPSATPQTPVAPPRNVAPAPQPAPPQPVVTPVQPAIPPRAQEPLPAPVQRQAQTPSQDAAQNPQIQQTKPAQVARVEPQRPTTSKKLTPRKKAPPALSREQEKRFLDRGANLAELGDIAGARLVFEYAALRGSGQAMFALAQTFDPEYLSARGVIGVAPDVKVAVSWYRKASRLGINAAAARAKDLEAQLGQR